MVKENTKCMCSVWSYVVTVLVTAVITGAIVYSTTDEAPEGDDGNQQVVQEPSGDDMLVPTVHPLTGKSFQQYIDRRDEFNTQMPLDQAKIFQVKGAVLPCEPDSDGPCGFDLNILGPEDWQNHSGEKQVFYFMVEGGAGQDYVGPFEDDLQRLIAEAKAWKK